MSSRTTFLSTLITAGSLALGGSLLMGASLGPSMNPGGAAVISAATPAIAPGSGNADARQAARDKIYLEEHPGERIEDSTQAARNKAYFEEHPEELNTGPMTNNK